MTTYPFIINPSGASLKQVYPDLDGKPYEVDLIMNNAKYKFRVTFLYGVGRLLYAIIDTDTGEVKYQNLPIVEGVDLFFQSEFSKYQMVLNYDLSRFEFTELS